VSGCAIIKQSSRETRDNIPARSHMNKSWQIIVHLTRSSDFCYQMAFLLFSTLHPNYAASLLLPRSATRLLGDPITRRQMIFRFGPLLPSLSTPALCVSKFCLELIYQLSCTSKFRLRLPCVLPFHLIVVFTIHYLPVGDLADLPKTIRI
jgi:hypothetical protein